MVCPDVCLPHLTHLTPVPAQLPQNLQTSKDRQFAKPPLLINTCSPGTTRGPAASPRGEIWKPRPAPAGRPHPWPATGSPECGLADQPPRRLKFSSELCGWGGLPLRAGTVADGIRYSGNFTDRAPSASQKKFEINSSASQQKSPVGSEA